MKGEEGRARRLGREDKSEVKTKLIETKQNKLKKKSKCSYDQNKNETTKLLAEAWMTKTKHCIFPSESV